MPDQIKHILFIVRTANLGTRAPSRRLLKAGFDHAPMVTTAFVRIRRQHRRIRRDSFAKALQEGNVLAYEKDYGGYHGFLESDFRECLARSQHGVLMIGSPNLASQMKKNRPETLVTVLQSSGADLSHYLRDLKDVKHHVIEVDSLAFGESQRVYDNLRSLLTPTGMLPK